MRLISLGEYEGALRRIILTAKHDRANNLQGWLLQAGGSLAKGWLTRRTVVDVPLAGSPLLIVPVPSQWTRWWRGLMVTPHIARGFASHLEAEGIDVMVAPVLTKAWGSTQAGKSGAQRRARSNTVSALVDLRGAQCILVDDVVTTGATMLACRRAVEYAGGHCFVGVSLADVHNCRPLK
ncbi:ComF family protein [Gleimia europaea]|nr:phosphoribosyltransferase family protein [Gleimia europaea]